MVKNNKMKSKTCSDLELSAANVKLSTHSVFTTLKQNQKNVVEAKIITKLFPAKTH